MAASWENEHNANMAAARVLLQRALRLMPENQQLWHEYFRLELIYIEKIKLRRRILGIDQQKNAEDLEPMDTEKDDDNTIQLPAVTGEDVEEWNQTEDAATSKLKKMTHDEAAALEEANNPILQGLLATIIYDNAITAIPQDIEFRKQFVSIYGEFTDTQKHIEHVFETIRRDMMQDPAAVAFLATRHLGSLPLSDPAFIPALRQCVQDFEQSLTNLPQPEMWLQYIQFLQNWFDLVSELNLKSYLSKQLLKTFKSCHKQHHDMNVALFEAWTHHLVQIGNTEKADDIATQGLEHYPSSVALWLHRIQLSNEDHDQQRSFYVKALDLNPASLTLWTSYKNWILKEKEEETDTLLWQACTKATALLPSVSTSTNDRNEIKDMLQTNYVAWTAETKGIEKARDVYKKIILHCYPTRAFFMKCVEVEGHYGEGDEQGQASVEYLYDRLTRLEQDKEGKYLSS
jgi:U3 small nucleolar RNA-associated protein 6